MTFYQFFKNNQRKYLANFLCYVLAGFTGGLIFYQIQTSLLQYINEYHILEFEYLTLLGIGTGIIIFIISSILNKIIIEKNKKLITIIFSLIYLGLFFGLYLGNDTGSSWILITISYGISIYIGALLFSKSQKPSIVDIRLLFGNLIGGIIGGVLISLAFINKVNFSIDEGYFLLTIFSLSLIGLIFGLLISIFSILFNLALKNKHNFFSNQKPKKTIILPVFFIIIFIFILTIFNYWDSMNLNDEIKFYSTDNYENLFFCNNDNEKLETDIFRYNNNDLIKLLENKPIKDIGTVFWIYYLSDDENDSLKKFKDLLITDAQNGKFIDISGSVKYWQYETMARAYYFLLANDKDPNIFSASEKDLIIDWFKELNDQAYQIGWVDYVYGTLFKKLPAGPYPNQEIGSGLLAILSEVLNEKYPDVASKNIKYIEKSGIGWNHNFRNPDDQIVYAHQIWQKNSFMMSKYGGYDESLSSNNSKNSFEWVLLQWPSNGMSPAYNVALDYTPFDTMMMGSYIHDDGRYLWLAEKMLDDEMKNKERKIDYIIGLEKIENSLHVEKPTVGSCYMVGPTGIAQGPRHLMPDKMVFRDGWEDDSLFALLNLRFSGWHSYKATNSFISIMYGEPFVVEELDLLRHPWLPKAKSDHRDKKIDRIQLNGFILEKKGLEELVYRLSGIGSKWEQDPPKFAQVHFFNSTKMMDFAKTSISDWHGWDHDRITVLVRDEYIAIFDNAKGDNNRDIGITWNLKGETKFSTDSIKLTQGDNSLIVHYPHSEEDYQVMVFNNTSNNSPAGKIHDSNTALHFLSEDSSSFEAITLAIPDTKTEVKVERITPYYDDGFSAFPDAMSVKVHDSEQTDLLSVRLQPGYFTYENIRTDAEIFIARNNFDFLEISFFNANDFKINSQFEPKIVELNGNNLLKNKDWFFQNNSINISNISEKGNIMIRFD